MPEGIKFGKTQQQQGLQMVWNKTGNKKPFHFERVNTIVLKGFS